MKKLQQIILVLGFLAVTTVNAFAQLLPTPKTVDLTAHAKVQAVAKVQSVADIEFGDILPNGTAKIVPNGANSGVTVDAQYGTATITPPSVLGIVTDYSITFPSSVTLTSAESNTLEYKPTVFESDQAGDAANSTQVTSGAHLDLGNLNLGAGDPIYLYVGGTIGPLSDQPAGEYTGTLTITVSAL